MTCPLVSLFVFLGFMFLLIFLVQASSSRASVTWPSFSSLSVAHSVARGCFFCCFGVVVEARGQRLITHFLQLSCRLDSPRTLNVDNHLFVFFICCSPSLVKKRPLPEKGGKPHHAAGCSKTRRSTAWSAVQAKASDWPTRYVSSRANLDGRCSSTRAGSARREGSHQAHGNKLFSAAAESKNKELGIDNIRGTTNAADLMTKHLDGKSLSMLCSFVEHQTHRRTTRCNATADPRRQVYPTCTTSSGSNFICATDGSHGDDCFLCK